MALSGDIVQRLIQGSWRGLSRPPSRGFRHLAPRLDPLEDRVVLSRFGGFDAGAYSSIRFAGTRALPAGFSVTYGDSTSTSISTSTGAETGSTTLATPLRRARGHGGRNVIQDADLTAHLEQLRADREAVLSGSEVTDAQRLDLQTDLRQLSQTGFCLDSTTLAPVVDSLLATIADGTYDSDPSVAQANQEAFTALFADSGVDQTLLDRTYADIVAIARNLNISTAELSILASDQDAIQANLDRLGITLTKGYSQSNLDFIFLPGHSFRGPRRGRF